MEKIVLNKRSNFILEMVYIVIPDVEGIVDVESVVDVVEVIIKLPIAAVPTVVTYITCAV